jgi:Ca2+-binding RTX toxin-like protein
MFLYTTYSSTVYGHSSVDTGSPAPLFDLPNCSGETKYSWLNDPAWSPDGTRVAGVRRCRDATKDSIYIADVSGENVQEYTHDGLAPTSVQELTWLDADHIFISEYTPGNNSVTHILSLADGTLTTANIGGIDPMPSADGSRIASLCDSDPITYLYALCVFDTSTQQTQKFLPGSISYADFTFSPDGSAVAVVAGKTVAVVDLTTGAAQTIVDRTTNSRYVTGVEWSPVRNTIIYGAYANKHREMHVIRPDGSNDQVILEGTPQMLSPTGRRISYYSDDTGWSTSYLDGTVIGENVGSGVWQPCPTGTCAGPDILSAPCTVSGTNRPDVLQGTSGDDVICGHGGNDRIVPGGGHDIVRGGSGSNTIDLRNSPRGVTVDIAAGTETGWGNVTLDGVQHAQGSAYDDVLKGDSLRNVLSGNGGNDDLLGFGSDDTLLGGAGNDYFRGGLGGDDIVGDDGVDQVSYSGSRQHVRVNLGSGTATGDGEDMLISIERVAGSKYDDFIVGSSGRNVIWAGDGLDTVESGGGNDVVYGGDEKDYLYGQGGDDDLYGDDGPDYLNGGSGRDHCRSGIAHISC